MPADWWGDGYCHTPGGDPAGRNSFADPGGYTAYPSSPASAAEYTLEQLRTMVSSHGPPPGYAT